MKFKRYPILRFATYGAFLLTVGGVAFGEYYAGTAPRRLRPIERNKPLVAIAGYTEAIRLNPSESELYFRRGRTDFHLGRYADAIQDLTRALELSPNKPEYLASRGFSFLLAGDIRSAEPDISRALKSGYQDPEAQMAQGMILQSQGKLQDAVKEYTAALSRSDFDAVSRCATLVNRGNVYWLLKSYAEAEEDDTTVINSCEGPDRENAFVNRGIVRASKGDRAAAFGDWEEALRLDPNDPVVFKDRAESYIDEGRLQLALEDYTRYLQLRPDDAYTYLVRSSLYERLGESMLAQSDRETAQEMIRTNRGRSYGPMPYYQRVGT